jgi:hypothetical protein
MRSRNDRETQGTALLVAWMTSSGSNYTQLAAAVGVGANSAYCWMTGRTRPRVELWARIEQVTAGRVPAVSWMHVPERQAVEAEG